MAGTDAGMAEGGTNGKGGSTGAAGAAGSGGATTSSAGGGGAAGGAGGSPGCVPQDAGATVVADSVYGFSGTQGQCGWSYGYLPDGAEPFTALTIYVAGTESIWEESTSHPPWIVTYATAQHPNLTPLQWNDRRWTSTVAGTVYLKGQLAKSDTRGGDGITGHIRVAGTEVWHATIAYNDTVGATFLLSADVQLGTTIDFLVDPNADIGFDTTTFTVVISQ